MRLLSEPTFLIGFVFLMTILEVCSANDGECDEKSLRRCLSTLRSLVKDEFNPARKTEADIDDYCLNVQKESFCLLGNSEPCTDSHPSITALSKILFAHLNQVCNIATEQRKVYMKMLPCFQKHTADFDNCTSGLLAGHEEDQVKEICSEMKTMLCVADTGRKLCGENGRVFAGSIELSVKDSYEEICTSAISCVTSSFGIIVLASLLVMFASERRMIAS